MTDLSHDEVSPDPATLEQINRVAKIVLMSIGLVLSLFLLSWTVHHKLSTSDPIRVSEITSQVRERQLSCLAKNIYREAGSEPFEGKVAVAQVVMNRVASGRFPDDICQTIYQKNVFYEKVVCQFSWVCESNTGLRPVNSAAYDQSMDVAKKVLLEGFRLPDLKEAMYFHTDDLQVQWKQTQVAHIGRHIFYK